MKGNGKTMTSMEKELSPSLMEIFTKEISKMETSKDKENILTAKPETFMMVNGPKINGTDKENTPEKTEMLSKKDNG